MSPEDIAESRDAARLSGVLPYLKAELDRQVTVVQTRTFAALDNGSLTPEAALLAWQEVKAATTLYRRLEQRSKIDTGG